jgi:hypothetical protein
MSQANVIFVEFNPEHADDTVVQDEQMHYVLQGIEASPEPLRLKPRNFTRKQVAEAFTHAFEMIGGVPRLALWAHQHPTDFFKLYAKLLPSTADDLQDATQKVYRMAVPVKALDMVDVKEIPGERVSDHD